MPVLTVAMTSSIGEVLGTSTVNGAAFEVSPALTIRTGPVMASNGTLTLKQSTFAENGADCAPYQRMRLSAASGSMPNPESTMLAPAAPLGGETDVRTSGGLAAVEKNERCGFTSGPPSRSNTREFATISYVREYSSAAAGRSDTRVLSYAKPIEAATRVPVSSSAT